MYKADAVAVLCTILLSPATLGVTLKPALDEEKVVSDVKPVAMAVTLRPAPTAAPAG